MAKPYEIKAFVNDRGQRTPFHLQISRPSRDRAHGDYFCQVRAPLLFEGAKKIYGIDAAQARLLAVNFVRSLLGERQVTDESGQTVTLEY